MISGMHGEYFRYPLRVQPKCKWSDHEWDSLSPSAVVMTNLTFHIRTPRYLSIEDYNNLVPPVIEWECMSCVEAGNEWVGVDPNAHGEAHQMGFDYAVTWLEKEAARKRLVREGK